MNMEGMGPFEPAVETLEGESLLPEIQEQVSKVKEGFEGAQKAIDRMNEIIKSFEEKEKDTTGTEAYNAAVHMIDEVAEIVGGGDYGHGLRIINNPESFNLINEEVALNHAYIAVERRPGGGMNNLMGKKEYPAEVLELMKKREELVAEIQSIIKKAKDLKEAKKALM